MTVLTKLRAPLIENEKSIFAIFPARACRKLYDYLNLNDYSFIFFISP